MGLAVSQVRLLALTSRKADIELEMQIDSKRKQMLTRKSTELAQQYYNRLQNSSIQFATSDGYEDVNYSYIMGAQAGNGYSSDFLSQVTFGNLSSSPQKPITGMILTDQYGRVVVNDQLAKIIQKADDTYRGTLVDGHTAKVKDITAYALMDFIDSNQSTNQAFQHVWNTIKDLGDDAIKVLTKLLDNGGYQNGGVVYVVTEQGESPNTWSPNASTVFYQTLEDAKNCQGAETGTGVVALQDGYCYRVLNQNGAIMRERKFYMDGQFFDKISDTDAQYLANIVSYFGTIISAALQNGTTAKIESNNVGKIKVDTESADSIETQVGRSLNDGEYGFTVGDFGTLTYWKKEGGTVSSVSKTEYDEAIQYNVTSNTGYVNALETDKLQAGFKSGVYQLVMVSDPSKGTYHRNTTLSYFTHMNYVVEKTDTSKKEEITAWFNKEQAAISEQETYWDTEITNLSTELNSVNTEIDSVKQLKSNAIKSAFTWGD